MAVPLHKLGMNARNRIRQVQIVSSFLFFLNLHLIESADMNHREPAVPLLNYFNLVDEIKIITILLLLEAENFPSWVNGHLFKSTPE